MVINRLEHLSEGCSAPHCLCRTCFNDRWNKPSIETPEQSRVRTERSAHQIMLKANTTEDVLGGVPTSVDLWKWVALRWAR